MNLIYTYRCIYKSTTWRLNSHILNDLNIREKFSKEIGLYFQENDKGDVTPSVLWDSYKAVLRGKIIALTSPIKKQKKEKLGKLQLDLNELQRQHKNTLDDDKTIEIKRLQNEIDAIYSEETQKKLMFLKQNYYEAGNKSLKWLAFKLRKYQADSAVHRIKHPKQTSTMELLKYNRVSKHTIEIYTPSPY